MPNRILNPRGRLPSVVERQKTANAATKAQTPPLGDNYLVRPNVTSDGVVFQPRTSDTLDATPAGQNRMNKLGRYLLTSFPWFGYRMFIFGALLAFLGAKGPGVKVNAQQTTFPLTLNWTWPGGTNLPGTNYGFQLMTSGDLLNWQPFAPNATYTNIQGFTITFQAGTNAGLAQYYGITLRQTLWGTNGAGKRVLTNAFSPISNPALWAAPFNPSGVQTNLNYTTNGCDTPGLLPVNVSIGAGGGGGGNTDLWTNSFPNVLQPTDTNFDLTLDNQGSTQNLKLNHNLAVNQSVFSMGTTDPFCFQAWSALASENIAFWEMSSGLLHDCTVFDPGNTDGLGCRYILDTFEGIGDASPLDLRMVVRNHGTNCFVVTWDGSIETANRTNQWQFAGVTNGIPHAKVDGTDYALGTGFNPTTGTIPVKGVGVWNDSPALVSGNNVVIPNPNSGYQTLTLGTGAALVTFNQTNVFPLADGVYKGVSVQDPTGDTNAVYSPPVTWVNSAWSTNAGALKTVQWGAYETIARGNDPTAVWHLASKLEGAAAADQLQLNQTGTETTAGGYGSKAADAAVAIAPTGWTNTLGKNAQVQFDGTAMTYKIFNNTGTAMYTNAAALTHGDCILQPSGAVTISGTGVTGSAFPF